MGVAPWAKIRKKYHEIQEHLGKDSEFEEGDILVSKFVYGKSTNKTTPSPQKTRQTNNNTT